MAFGALNSEALHGTPRLVVEVIIRLVVLGVVVAQQVERAVDHQERELVVAQGDIGGVGHDFGAHPEIQGL